MAKLTILVAVLPLIFAVISSVTGNATGRVIGGYGASDNQFPYQVSLRKNNEHKCGGSIISPNYILTAAKCVVDYGNTVSDPKLFTVLAGTINRTAGGIIVPVKRLIINTRYNGVSYDIALVELEENFEFSPAIQPIELATEEVLSGEEVIISGWGRMGIYGSGSPNMLKWQKLTAISKEECAAKTYKYSSALICLDHPMGVGACDGDFGGPAIYQGKLVGVANNVMVTCGTARPDGYAKVSYYIDWIHNNMN